VSSSSPSPGVVVVVDDEESVRRSSSRLLSRAGFEVIEAASAEEAFALGDAHERPVDVVLSDVVMPGMTGIELAGAVSERWPRAEVVLFSGFTPAALARHELTGAQAPVILQKPLERQELVDAVAAAAARARSRA
jgi:FixJ family two-component response regulator